MASSTTPTIQPQGTTMSPPSPQNDPVVPSPAPPPPPRTSDAAEEGRGMEEESVVIVLVTISVLAFIFFCVLVACAINHTKSRDESAKMEAKKDIPVAADVESRNSIPDVNAVVPSPKSNNPLVPSRSWRVKNGRRATVPVADAVVPRRSSVSVVSSSSVFQQEEPQRRKSTTTRRKPSTFVEAPPAVWRNPSPVMDLESISEPASPILLINGGGRSSISSAALPRTVQVLSDTNTGMVCSVSVEDAQH